MFAMFVTLLLLLWFLARVLSAVLQVLVMWIGGVYLLVRNRYCQMCGTKHHSIGAAFCRQCCAPRGLTPQELARRRREQIGASSWPLR
jgi:hypothetical protein